MKRILLLGNLNSTLQNIYEYLSDDFMVQMASDNVDIARSMIELNKPDMLIFSQVGLDDDNGLYGLLREVSRTSKTPVLGIATLEGKYRFDALKQDISRFEYVVRPVIKNDLINICYRILEEGVDSGGASYPDKESDDYEGYGEIDGIGSLDDMDFDDDEAFFKALGINSLDYEMDDFDEFDDLDEEDDDFEYEEDFERKQALRRRPLIMIVDDSEITLLRFERMLREKYRTVTVDSGPKALKAVYDAPPNLILLDYIMPEWDGKKTYDIIKSVPMGKDIPIIFITGEDNKKNIIEALRRYPDGYLIKPVNPKELFRRIDIALKRRLKR